MKWKAWPHLVDLLKIFLTHKDIVILKARQLGVSWLVVGYCLWQCLFYENVKVLFLSQGQDEASDLVGGGEAGSFGKAKFIYSHLPSFFQSGLGRDTQTLIDFVATGSSMMALPSTEKAGRSTDATIVVRDELERHPLAENNFAAVGPTIDAGGQSIDLSTTNKLAENTHFKERYQRAKVGDSGTRAIFLGANLRPGRDEKWWEYIRNKYPAWQVEQEYPLTEKEALGTLKSRAFFDLDAIEAMYADILIPLEHELSDKYKGLVRIYRLPSIGRRYCLFTDPSDGKDDPHAMIVIDAVTGEEMAESHGKIPADEVAQIHDELARLYKAFNSYEINSTAGGHFDAKIKELETPNQCHRLQTNGKLDDKQWGWFTGKAVKNKAIWGLEEIIRTRQFIPHSKEIIDELGQFVQPEGEDPQKPAGGHDDYIDALGRAFLLRDYMPPMHQAGFKTWLRKERTY